MHREAWWEPSSSTPAEASVVPGTLTTLWVRSAQTRCLAVGQGRGRSVSSVSPQAESSKSQGQAELGALLEHRRMDVQIKGKRETGSLSITACPGTSHRAQARGHHSERSLPGQH